MAKLEYEVTIKTTKWFRLFKYSLGFTPFIFEIVFDILIYFNPPIVTANKKVIKRFKDILK